MSRINEKKLAYFYLFNFLVLEFKNLLKLELFEYLEYSAQP